MVHYNVWFALREGVDTKSGLSAVDLFLRELCLVGEASSYRLLENASEGARTKLPRYQATIEFADDAALSRAMKNQVARGIHNGAHGAVVNAVSDFRVEIFRLLEPELAEPVFYACEI